MQPFKLTPNLSIGPEPTDDDIAALKSAGFRSIINNRTDGEDEIRLNSDEMALAAENHGLAYAYVPVKDRNPLERDAQAFEDAMEDLPGPVHAYCKTGGRSAALWALTSVMSTPSDELISQCAAAGHDVSGLRTKMDMRREMLEDEED